MVRKIREEKKQTSTLWIFCEGLTETRYLENLRVTERLRLKIKPILSSYKPSEQIVDEALKFMSNRGEFDKNRDIVACFFDRDDKTQNSNEILLAAKKKARDKIILGYSNPSFEYWILCHHGYYPDVSYDQNQVYELVKTKFNLDTKSEKELYEKTKDRIELAKKNAKKIKEFHLKNNVELISRESTPLTLVYEVLNKINEFK
ncbi:MAG: RloB family protein [Candidatus Nanoarchaeia archaeon]|nr:RloB family protein [Candidatus Nanoarchaeia archaeon]